MAKNFERKHVDFGGVEERLVEMEIKMDEMRDILLRIENQGILHANNESTFKYEMGESRKIGPTWMD